MPSRFIKETICTSEEIDKLSWEAEVLFYRLIVKCDDFGLFFGAVPLIKSNCYPWKADKLKDKDLEKWLAELQHVGLVVLYEYDSKRYLKLTKWEKHQQTRAVKSRFPTPDIEGVQVITIDNNGKQMSPYSYSYSYSYSDIHSLSFAPEIELSKEEYEKLVTEYGQEVTKEYCERLNDYILQIGKAKAKAKYKSHYAVIKNWYRRDKKEELKPGQTQRDFSKVQK